MNIIHLTLCSLFNEKYAYQDNLLPRYHKKLGHNVTIIAPTYATINNNGQVYEELKGAKYLSDGCKLIRVSPLIKSYKINNHLHLFKNIAPIIEAENPDLIFTHGVNCFNYLCLINIKKKYPNIQIVFDNHMDNYNSCQNILSKFLNKVIFKNLISRKLNKIGKIFYGVTPSRCSFLHDTFGIPQEKIKLLYMGADDDKMQYEKHIEIRKKIRSQYNICDNDFLIITGGKIDTKKNIHLLLKAVSEYPCKHVKVLFFGSIEDKLKEYITKLLSNRIIYIGWISSDNVYQYFYAGDIIIFPGLHSVLWEQAIASKRPCIFNHLKGFDHINLEGNCLFLEQSNIDYYKSIINNVFTDKALYKSLLDGSQTSRTEDFMYSKIALKVIYDIKNNIQ